ncbi:MAG TPA: ATP-dependent sacrificial sulfur transferase LarE [Pyrinomonadaceae bacterium]
MQTLSDQAITPADAHKNAVPNVKPEALTKEQKLRHMMRGMGRVLVAYSGGVDSTYLAYVANGELGENALCVLGVSPSVPDFQIDQATTAGTELGLRFISVRTVETEDARYIANPTNRCYFCKSELYEKLSAIARDENILFVVDGMNADDLTDHRPGRAAAREHKVSSPLAEVGLTKQEIRHLSRSAGIRAWDKPSSPCLASRIAYGTPVTIERLSKVERAEAWLREMGFREFRVRVHGELARIEIAPSEMERALSSEFARLIDEKFTEFGFKYVTLDLRGFRSGAMNEILT